MPAKETKTFTKSDFLSATQLAEKLNVDKEKITALMEQQFRRGTKILTAGGPRDMIYQAKWSHHTSAGQRPNLRLHPLAMEKFKELLEKGK